MCDGYSAPPRCRRSEETTKGTVVACARNGGCIMHVAHRSTHQQQLSLRTVLVLAGATLMIIVGLLGMHTFSTDPVGHGTATPAPSASAVDHTDPMAAPAAELHASSCDDVCMTGSAGGHSEMTTACILALLAGLLLLLRPLLAHRLGPPLQLLTSRLRLDNGRALNRAPSLTFLSISRT